MEGHAPFRREIIVTFNQSSCTIIQLCSSLFLLRNISLVSDATQGQLVSIPSTQVLTMRNLFCFIALIYDKQNRILDGIHEVKAKSNQLSETYQ